MLKRSRCGRVTAGVVQAAIGAVCAASGAWAATIDTDFIQGPWPKQTSRSFEVGKHEVQWRQRASRSEGVFAGVRFKVPLDRQAVWDLGHDYRGLGRVTPGVTAVRLLERQPTRQVIELDVKVFWKMLQLTFEVEQEPPRVTRFRLVNEAVGEYRGVCVFEELSSGRAAKAAASRHTVVELSTWLKPSRPIPASLVLLAERITLLQGVRGFLETCEALAAPSMIHRGREAMDFFLPGWRSTGYTCYDRTCKRARSSLRVRKRLRSREIRFCLRTRIRHTC